MILGVSLAQAGPWPERTFVSDCGRHGADSVLEAWNSHKEPVHLVWGEQPAQLRPIIARLADSLSVRWLPDGGCFPLTVSPNGEVGWQLWVVGFVEIMGADGDPRAISGWAPLLVSAMPGAPLTFETDTDPPYVPVTPSAAVKAELDRLGDNGSIDVRLGAGPDGTELLQLRVNVGGQMWFVGAILLMPR